MKHTPYYIYIASVALALSACNSSDLSDFASLSDEAKDQIANAKLISFSAGGTEKQITRATYRNWTAADFKTMSVFGWHDLSPTNWRETSENKMFYNTKNTYGDKTSPWTEAWYSPTDKWTYESPQYWADYTTFNSFDFFACMPYASGATFEKVSDNNYKLSMPVTVKEDDATSALTTSETAYLSNAKHLSIPYYEEDKTAIPFQFDQTLAGFKLEFQLGRKMAEIRQFRIKSVKIKEANLPVSGTATRTYTWNGSKWSAEDITWESITKQLISEKPIEQVADYYNTLTKYNETNGLELSQTEYDALTDAEKKYLLVTKDTHSWGGTHYFIPSVNDFTPTITVTYDVEVVKEDGHTVVTRKDVVSSIEVNQTNFTLWNADNVKPANIITLHINIVPDYLYVLSDYDHTTGVLVVDTK